MEARRGRSVLRRAGGAGWQAEVRGRDLILSLSPGGSLKTVESCTSRLPLNYSTKVSLRKSQQLLKPIGSCSHLREKVVVCSEFNLSFNIRLEPPPLSRRKSRSSTNDESQLWLKIVNSASRKNLTYSVLPKQISI